MPVSHSGRSAVGVRIVLDQATIVEHRLVVDSRKPDTAMPFRLSPPASDPATRRPIRGTADIACVFDFGAVAAVLTVVLGADQITLTGTSTRRADSDMSCSLGANSQTKLIRKLLWHRAWSEGHCC
jgi:hypothetical protein